MSGTYLQVGRGPLGLWRWWLTNSLGAVTHRNSYGYVTEQGAIDAAYRSGMRFFG